MRHLLVDGHNVLLRGTAKAGFAPEEHRALRDRLLRAVAEFGRRQGFACRVAFDGASVDVAPWTSTRIAGVKVRYSPAGVEADRILLEWVRELEGEEVTLVTSDRSLAARAKSLGARILPAETLRSAPGEEPAGAGRASAEEGKPPHPGVTPEEMEDWVREFSKRPPDDPGEGYADPRALLHPSIRAREDPRDPAAAPREAAPRKDPRAAPPANPPGEEAPPSPRAGRPAAPAPEPTAAAAPPVRDPKAQARDRYLRQQARRRKDPRGRR